MTWWECVTRIGGDNQSVIARKGRLTTDRQSFTDDLVETLRWTCDIEVAADDMSVDRGTLLDRVRWLTPEERARLDQEFRDQCEESA